GPTPHRNLIQVSFLPEAGVEGKQNLVPSNNIATRLLLVLQLAAFQKTKMPHVMGRMILPVSGELRLAGARQGSCLRKDRIKDNFTAVFTLPPNPKMPAELFLPGVAAFLIGSDSQTNGGSGAGIGRSPHPFAKPISQRSGQDRKLAGTAHQINTGQGL